MNIAYCKNKNNVQSIIFLFLEVLNLFIYFTVKGKIQAMLRIVLSINVEQEILNKIIFTNKTNLALIE